MGTRLRVVDVPAHSKRSFCAEVDEGLSASPKFLPTRYLYDRAGSELFEAITELPEYYLTRCEDEILRAFSDEIVGLTQPSSIIEFGSGSSKKTRRLIESGLSLGTLRGYTPIDISKEFLLDTSRSLIGSYPGLTITALAAEYFDAVDYLPEDDGARLLLFLGSNIGNLPETEASEFLTAVAAQLRPSDRLLVGIDLAKEKAIIDGAYNDQAGVTARFNLNLLNRINRELDGKFDVESFRHEAEYDPEQMRVEMRLKSLTDQSVPIDAIGRSFDFTPGEAIHTEWCHKYTDSSFEDLARNAGLKVEQTWKDDRHWFAEKLLSRL